MPLKNILLRKNFLKSTDFCQILINFQESRPRLRVKIFLRTHSFLLTMWFSFTCCYRCRCRCRFCVYFTILTIKTLLANALRIHQAIYITCSSILTCYFSAGIVHYLLFSNKNLLILMVFYLKL